MHWMSKCLTHLRWIRTIVDTEQYHPELRVVVSLTNLSFELEDQFLSNTKSTYFRAKGWFRKIADKRSLLSAVYPRKYNHRAHRETLRHCDQIWCGKIAKPIPSRNKKRPSRNNFYFGKVTEMSILKHKRCSDKRSFHIAWKQHKSQWGSANKTVNMHAEVMKSRIDE